MKVAKFVGDSLERIRQFPAAARSDAGHQIYRVQIGLDPTDWKSLKIVGPSAREIRVRDESGAYRVVYVATMMEAVYVLNAFHKKSQTTPRKELELAAKRYAELMRK